MTPYLDFAMRAAGSAGSLLRSTSGRPRTSVPRLHGGRGRRERRTPNGATRTHTGVRARRRIRGRPRSGGAALGAARESCNVGDASL